MRLCVLLPYANPHVTGWLNEYIAITGSSVTVGISKSVREFRSSYFIEADNNKRYLYLYKDEDARKEFTKEVKNADVFVTLGIFNRDFLKYILFTKRGVKLYVLSEPYNPISSQKSLLTKRLYSYVVRLVISPANISFLAIGGEEVKKYYLRLGFRKSSFYTFGYFPNLDWFDVKKKPVKTNIRFLFIGQLIERKGIAVLKELVEYLAAKFNGWDMEIIGTGDKLNEIELLCKRHSQVKYLGVIDNNLELFRHYQAADILFLPSYFDGWGAVVNEGLSCGCSLLLSKYVHASGNLLIDGENGYSFDPNNIETLLAKVDNYFYEDGLLMRHAKKSQEVFKVWNHINAAKLLSGLLESGISNENDYKLLKLI